MSDAKSKEALDLNGMVVIRVEFLDKDPQQMAEICSKNILGEHHAVNARMQFSWVVPDRVGGSMIVPNSGLPEATVALTPVGMLRAGEVAGYIGFFMNVDNVYWGKNGDVTPEDVLPKKIEDLKDVQVDKIHVYNGTALGQSTSIRVLIDANQFASRDGHYEGFVDLLMGIGQYSVEEGFFRLYVPSPSLRSENGIFPFFGSLVESPNALSGKSKTGLQVDELSADVIAQALAMCQKLSGKSGDYTKQCRTLLGKESTLDGQGSEGEAGKQNSAEQN